MNDTLTPAQAFKETKLTLHDLCDAPGVKSVTAPRHREEHPSCGSTSRAYVLVQLPNGFDLALCKHHYELMEVSLMSAGAIVLDDQRSRLDVKLGGYGDADGGA
jgi:hypothetical protein